MTVYGYRLSIVNGEDGVVKKTSGGNGYPQDIGSPMSAYRLVEPRKELHTTRSNVTCMTEEEDSPP